MADAWKTIVSALVSLTISGIGWYLVAKRANKSSRRSETFSLLNPVISLLSEFQSMAEEAFNTPSPLAMKDEDFELNGMKVVNKQQIFEIKFHTKYDLLRCKLGQLEQRKVEIPGDKLIELRKAYTLEKISSPLHYQQALRACHDIEKELHVSFDREYNIQ